MKTKNTNTRKNKFLRIGASGILLAILFVFVFAGVLSASFAVERNAIETGQLEANVASAAGTWNEGVSASGGLNAFDTVLNIWSKVHYATWWGGDDTNSRTMTLGGDLATYAPYGVMTLQLYYNVTDDNSNYTLTYSVKESGSSSNIASTSHKMNSTGVKTVDATAGFTSTTLVFSFHSGGSSTNASNVEPVGVKFFRKSYTITLNKDGGTGGSGNQTVYGGSTPSQVSTPSKSGYTFLGYYITDTNTMLYDANGNIKTGVSGYTDASGNWIKNANVSVTARWSEHSVGITYNKNTPSFGTVNDWPSALNSAQTYMYSGKSSDNTSNAFNIETASTLYGTNCVFVGWDASASGSTTSPTYAPGSKQRTNSGTFDVRTASMTKTVYATWAYIQFTFGNGAAAGTGGTAYTASNQYSTSTALSVLKGISGYLSVQTSNLPSGYSSTIQYSTQSGSSWGSYSSTQPTSVGHYKFKITIKDGSSVVRGVRETEFDISAGDFGELSSHTDTAWGTVGNPYVIESVAHLIKLARIVNGTATPDNSVKGLGSLASDATTVQAADRRYTGCYFYLNANLTITSTGGADQFAPIGTYENVSGGATVGDYRSVFAGYFLGNGHTLTVNISVTRNYGGIFGYTSGGAIADLKIAGTQVNVTGNYVGGIVGYSSGTTIIGCTNGVTVQGNDSVGGIVGFADGGSVQNCYNSGAIGKNTSTNVGGIIGKVKGSATITSVVNKGTANGTGTNIGSLIGGYDSGSPTISLSFALTNQNAFGFVATGESAVISAGTTWAAFSGASTGATFASNSDHFANNYKTVEVSDMDSIMPRTYASSPSSTFSNTTWENIAIKTGGSYPSATYYNINAFAVSISGINDNYTFVIGAYSVSDNQITFAYNSALSENSAVEKAWNSTDKQVIGDFRFNYGSTNIWVGKMEIEFKNNSNLEGDVTTDWQSDNKITFSNTPQGPMLRGLKTSIALGANYSATSNIYTNTNLTPYSLSDRPTNAGEYLYTANISLSGSVVGHINRSFEIEKRKLLLEDVWTGTDSHDSVTDANGTTPKYIEFVYRSTAQGLEQIIVSSENGGFYGSISNTGTVTITVPSGSPSTGTNVFSAVNARSCSIKGTNVDDDDYIFILNLSDTRNYTLYNADGSAEYGDSVTYSYSIRALDFENENDLDLITFGYRGEDVGNSDSWEYNSTTYYTLRQFAGDCTSGIAYDKALAESNANPSLVYYFASTYHDFGNNIFIRIRTNTTEDATYSAPIAPSGNFSASATPSMSASDSCVGGVVKITGSDNYTGDFTVFFKLMQSDFGGNFTLSNWGKASNPFVIGDIAHLMRLQQIIAGQKPWNSVNKYNNQFVNNSVPEDITASNNGAGTVVTYANAYFVLGANLTVSTAGGFSPIGDETHYFAGTFDGGRYTQTDFKCTYDYYINMALNTDADALKSYMGLFGHTNGAAIKNLHIIQPINTTGLKGASYVGGIVGFAENTVIDGCSSEVKIAASGDYVGGIVGKGDNTYILDTYFVKTYEYSSAETDSNIEGVAAVKGNDYVGGLAGELTGTSNIDVTSTGARKKTMYSASGSSPWTNIKANESDETSQMDLQSKVHAHIVGRYYVGGYVGKMTTSQALNFKPMIRIVNADTGVIPNTSDATIAHIVGASYVGAVFGYVKSTNTSHESTINIAKSTSGGNSYINASVLANGAGNAIGGIAGFVGNVSIVVANGNISTANFFKSNTSDTSKGKFFNLTSGAKTSYFGGIAGILGSGATIKSFTENGVVGTYYLVNLAVVVDHTQNYVGGAVGYVSPTAGDSVGNNQTVFGNTVKFRNLADITASGDYVGGIVGYMGVNGANGNSATLPTGVDASEGTATAGQIVTFAPRYPTASGTMSNGAAQNTGNIYGNDYVGGIVGYVGEYSDGSSALKGARVDFVNAQLGTTAISLDSVAVCNVGFNGSDTLNDSVTVFGRDYVGGIVGYVAGSENTSQLTYVFATANTGTSGIYGQNYVGGLVGCMDKGFVNNCFFARYTGTAMYTSTRIYGTGNYVGVLVGYLQNGNITDSIGFGYNYAVQGDHVGYDYDGTVGGVVGDLEIEAKVINSWAVYYVASNTYEKKIDKSRGNGVIISQDSIMHVPSFDEIAQMVGLRTGATGSATDSTNCAGGKGYLSFAFDVADNDKQVAFYDASGTDSTYDLGAALTASYLNYTSTSASHGSVGNIFTANNVVYLKLAMTVESFNICVKDVEFKNIPNCESSSADAQNKALVESAYRAPAGNGKYYPIVTTATYNSTTRRISKVNAIIMLQINSTKSIKVGYYSNSSFSTTLGTESNPYIISNLADWNAFAANVRRETSSAYPHNDSSKTSAYNTYVSSYFLLTADIEIKNGSKAYADQLAGRLGFKYKIHNDGFYGIGSDTKTLSKEYGSSYVFKGTFDGNGHKLTIKDFDAEWDPDDVIEPSRSAGDWSDSDYYFQSYAGYYTGGMSLFPYANGATFKNLEIAGRINPVGASTSLNSTYNAYTVGTGSQEDGGNNSWRINDRGYDVAAFVGKPTGTVTFVNCTSSAIINGARNAGGFVGYDNGKTTNLVDCLNTGWIETYQRASQISETESYEDVFYHNGTVKDRSIDTWNYDGGTGGLIGNVLGTANIDSCRNTGTVRGAQNVGGIVGRTLQSLTIYNCANSGAIIADSGYNKESTKQSTAKNQTGTANWLNFAGGILGKTAQNATIHLYASYNDGTITAFGNIAGGLVGGVGDFYPDKDYTEFFSGGSIAHVQGMSDFTSTTGQSVIAYCYNAGKVQTGGTSKKTIEAWNGHAEINLFWGDNGYFGNLRMTGTVAGGIVGTIGCGVISYCYNLGEIVSNGAANNCTSFSARVGGIVAEACPLPSADAVIAKHSANSDFDYRACSLGVDIKNCYNVGKISCPADDKSNSDEDWGGSLWSNGVQYGAGILGYVDYPRGEDLRAGISKNNIRISNCYSVSGCVAIAGRKDGTSTTAADCGDPRWFYNKDTSYYNDVFNCTSGIVCSLEELTAVLRNNSGAGDLVGPYDNSKFAVGGTDSMNVNNLHGGGSPNVVTSSANANGYQSGVGTLVKSNGDDIVSYDSATFKATYSTGSTVTVTEYGVSSSWTKTSSTKTVDKFLQGEVFGWIYVYGCLPQLAVFALGTYKGTSMLSTNYGKDNYGDYRVQQAGDQYSPYIVKDGVHLMSMSALASADKGNIYYDFHGKYVEAATADNNIKGAVTNSITMPTTSTTDDMYIGVGSAGTGSSNPTVLSKSHDLLSKGAMYQTNWNKKNYYATGTSVTYASGGATTSMTYANFYPIGGVGHKSTFKGYFDGHGLVINGLRTTMHSATNLNIGLFASTDGATIKNVTLSGGHVRGYSSAANTSYTIAVGGIVGRAGAGTKFENCSIAGDMGVKAGAAAANTSTKGYVGGIVGVVNPADGNNVEIKGSQVTAGTIETFNSGVGGVIGITDGAGGRVTITNCTVHKAVIRTTENTGTNKNNTSLGTNAGGLMGIGDDDVEHYVTNIKIGGDTSANLYSPVTAVGSAKVVIYGENAIGGIMGRAAKVFIAKNLSVHGDVWIERPTGQWGTVLNASADDKDYGTAIGGIFGYTPNIAGASIELGGTTLFAGYINIAAATNGSSSYVQNVGGVAGQMNSGARFEQSTATKIYVLGNITIGSTLNRVKNIGGVVGEVHEAAFYGNFYSKAGITASQAENVGGFVGAVTNRCEVLAGAGGSDTMYVRIGGTIAGASNVGGFVGYVAPSATLSIAPSPDSGGKTYIGILDILIGDNDNEDNFNLPDASSTNCNNTTISSSGNFVGGIVGNGSGSVPIGTKAQVINGGAVGGEYYVGGVIGFMAHGTLSGELTNLGTVSGSAYVGGTIGVLAANADGAVFKNAGRVTATGGNGIGGSIGIIGMPTDTTTYSDITGLAHEATINFVNNHAEYTYVASGNEAGLSVTGSGTGVGGVIGVVSAGVVWGALATGNLNTFYVSGDVSASSANSVGGVFGLIAADNVYIKDLLAYDTLVQGLNNVGGIVGEVTGENVTIAHSFNVTLTTSKGVNGATNVGGIVGKAVTTGTATQKTKAGSCYWYKGYQNAELENLDIQHLDRDLGKYQTISRTADTTTYFTESYCSQITPYEYDPSCPGINASSTWEWYFKSSGRFAIPSGYTVAKYNGTGWWMWQKTSFTAYTTGSDETGWYFVYSNDVNDSNSQPLIKTKYSDNDATNLAFWKYVTNCYSKSETPWAANEADHTSSIIYNNVFNGGGSITAATNSGTEQNPVWDYTNRDYLYAMASGDAPSGYYLYIATSYGGTSSSENNDTFSVYAIKYNSSDRDALTHMFVKAKNDGSAKNIAVFCRSVGAGKDLEYNGRERFAPLSVDVEEMPFYDTSTNTVIGAKQGKPYYYVYTLGTTSATVQDATSAIKATVAGTYKAQATIYYYENGTFYHVGKVDPVVWEIKAHALTATVEARNGYYGQSGAWGGNDAMNDNVNTLIVEIDGVAPGDITNGGQYIGFNFALYSNTTQSTSGVTPANGTYYTPNVAVSENLGFASTLTLVTYGESTSTSDIDDSDITSSAISAEAQSHSMDSDFSGENGNWLKYRFVFHFKDSKKYHIAVSLIETNFATYSSGTNVYASYTLNDSNAVWLGVNPITLTVFRSGADGSSYSGAGQKGEFTIGATGDAQHNWLNTTDMAKYLPEFGIKLIYEAKNKEGTTLSISEPIAFSYQSNSYNLTTGCLSPYAFDETQIGDTYVLGIDLLRDLGSYYINFTNLSTADGNYTLNLTTGAATIGSYPSTNTLCIYGITPSTITLSWAGSNEKVYDKTTGYSTLTFTSSNSNNTPFDNLLSTINTLFDMKSDGTAFAIMSGSSAVSSVVTQSGAINGKYTTVSIKFTTSDVNVADYVFKAEQKAVDNNITIVTPATNAENRIASGETSNMKYTQLTYKITPAPLSVTFVDTANVSYAADSNYTDLGYFVYNVGHQGLKSIIINGLYSGDVLTVGSSGDAGTGARVTVSGSSSAKSVSGSTITMNENCKNADDYRVTVALGASTNYTLATRIVTWEITQYDVEVSFTSVPTTKVYDGKEEKPSPSSVSGLDGGTFNYNSSTKRFTYNGEQVPLIFIYSGKTEADDDSGVNVGNYSVTVGVDNDNYNIIGVFPGNADSFDWSITARAITLGGWANTAPVYSGSAQCAYVNSLTLGSLGSRPATDHGIDPEDSTKYKVVFDGANNTTGNEQIILRITGIQTNAGSGYSVSVASFDVAGDNDAGETSVTNYTFTPLPSTTFSIAKSIISVSLKSGYPSSSDSTKTYDGNTDAEDDIGDAFSITSTNDGATACTITATSAKYSDYNVGTGLDITYDISVSDTTNYQLSNATIVASGVGEIERAQLVIKLNTKVVRSGQTTSYVATKVYDTTNAYATWSFTTTSAIKSNNYQMGQGFKVEGIVADEEGTLTITITFAESAESGRNNFNTFVNGVEQDNQGDYWINPSSAYKKKLIVSITGTGENSSVGNYTYMVSDGADNDLFDADKVPTESSLTFNVFDSSDTRASSNGQTSETTFKVSITQSTVEASYDPVEQSYVTATNEFNTDWVRVEGTLDSTKYSDVEIEVFNGWIFNDGNDYGEDLGHEHARKEYHTYTVIDSTNGLSAKLVGESGSEQNYILRNQPTLIIGYFVESGDAYQIGSISGLMLATYYYSMNFVDTSSGINQTIYKTEWRKLVTKSDYDTPASKFKSPISGLTIAGYTSTLTTTFTSWDEHFEWIEQHYTDAKGESITIFFDSTQPAASATPTGEWGFWENVPVEVKRYKNFVQVSNISGVLTSQDIDVLNGQVGSGNWSDFFPNFLRLSKGNAVVAIGSIFKNQGTTPFIGTYDGCGYTIEDVNIVAYATSSTPSTYNVGMFESIGSDNTIVNDSTTYHGSVANVNLRNFNIVFVDGNSVDAVTINVGGIAGFSQQTTALGNSSFHGTINVTSENGTVSVGGLIGKYDASGLSGDAFAFVNGAISIGSITVKSGTSSGSVYAGGIVGYVNNTGANAYPVNNVVSMTSILTRAATAQANIGGIIGYSAKQTYAVTGTKAYITDSVINRDYQAENDITISICNKYVGGDGDANGGNFSYTNLIGGSNSGYNSTDYLYYGAPSAQNLNTPARNTYDVIEDRDLVVGAAPYESLRLVDIVKIYVLHYSKIAPGETGNNTTKYKISTTSWLVGNKLGTDSRKLEIHNQQQVAYLREFRFASFTLERDINMYTHYNITPFVGAFFGSVTANNHTIDLVDSAQKKMFEIERSAHEVPIKP